jgi:hypothetical protein
MCDTPPLSQGEPVNLNHKSYTKQWI